MGARFPDHVLFDGEAYSLCEIDGTGLFDPVVDSRSDPADSGAGEHHSYVYGIRDDTLFLETFEARGDMPRPADLDQPVPFTGSMVMGTGFVDDLKVHMGIQAAYKYRKVIQLEVKEGRVLNSVDLSGEMADVRDRLAATHHEGAGDVIKNID
jgi:hypothetical protein